MCRMFSALFLKYEGFFHQELYVSSIGHKRNIPPERNIQLEGICNVKSHLALVPQRRTAPENYDLLGWIFTICCSETRRVGRFWDQCMFPSAPHEAFEF